MIRIKLFRDKGRPHLIGFEASGHSGYAPHGEDIVCAAISALTTAAVLGLQTKLKLRPSVATDERRGWLKCTIDPDTVDEGIRCRVDDILGTMALGLYGIERQYDTFVSVEEVIL